LEDPLWILYARAGVPEVWIVDLACETLERHTEPSESGYRRVKKAKRAEALASLTLFGLAVESDAVLG
jgi:Uma2 family endonuclease